MIALVQLRRRHPVLTRFVLTVVFTLVALVATYFLDPITNYNLAIGASMAIVILGLSFLTGFSGQVSLGNGAFMGVGAYAVAIWANHHSEGSLELVATLGLAILAGGVVGFVIGLPAARLRGPYLAGMTIAFALSFQSFLGLFSSWTGGDAPLQLPVSLNPPHFIVSLLNSTSNALAPQNMWLADVSILVAAIAFFFMANLFSSRTGRAMRLVRENDVAAELAGVSLPRARITAFVVSAAYAGLGGGLLAAIQGAVQPTTFELGLSITILSLLVIGGIGTLSGALIGGLIYAYADTSWIPWIVSKTGLNPTGNLASNLSGIIFAGLLILVMMLAPLGIAGTTRFVIARRVAPKVLRPTPSSAHQ